MLDAIGQPIGMGDSLIAGIPLSHDLPLFTRNLKHFQKVEGLRLMKLEIDLGSFVQAASQARYGECLLYAKNSRHAFNVSAGRSSVGNLPQPAIRITSASGNSCQSFAM